MMDDNLAIFLVLTVSITAAVVLVGIAAWFRSRQNHATQIADSSKSAQLMTLLRDENDGLKGQVEHLEDRVSVLERIVTDPATQTSRKIDALTLGDA